MKIAVIDRENKEKIVGINKLPDLCPACNKSGQPTFHFANLRPMNNNPWDDQHSHIEAVFRCPINACSRLFFAHYSRNERGYGNEYYFDKVFKLDAIEFTQFPESVKKIAEKFERIYNQALIADKNGLDEICGAGYRRALEFLIKDYLIYKTAKEKDKIISEFLGTAIKRINDGRIQKCARLAAWLGNDETHYYKKFKEQDIEDLKILIKLTVNWIESSELTDEYVTKLEK